MKKAESVHVPDTPGERVRKVRKKKKVTQEKLAEMLDCSSDLISLIERGERGLTTDKAMKIAQLFHVRKEYLLCFDDFETQFMQDGYTVLKPFMEKKKREKAVEALFDAVDLSFEVNVSEDSTLNLSLTDFEKLSEEEMQQSIDEVFSVIASSNAYAIKKDGEIWGYCSEDEKNLLFDEIFSFVEFKLNRLCEKGGRNNG